MIKFNPTKIAVELADVASVSLSELIIPTNWKPTSKARNVTENETEARNVKSQYVKQKRKK